MFNRQAYPNAYGAGMGAQGVPGVTAPFSFAGSAPVYPTTPSVPYPSADLPIGGPIPGVDTPVAAPAPVFEESYIENILRLNLGKTATIHMTFENNAQWNAKVFKGRLEAAGRDHIIISDPTTGMRHLLLMVNLDYVTFDQELNYEYPGHPMQATGVPVQGR
jgi:spore germination protein Q